MRSRGSLCAIFKSAHSSKHFRSRLVRCLCNCNMNFITSCLVVFLSCSFEACLLKVQSVSALFTPIYALLCRHISVIMSVCFLCEVLCTSSLTVRIRTSNRSMTTWRPVRIYIFPPRRQTVILRQIGLVPCKTVRTGKRNRRGRLAYAGITNVRSS